MAAAVMARRGGAVRSCTRMPPTGRMPVLASVWGVDAAAVIDSFMGVVIVTAAAIVDYLQIVSSFL